MRKIKIFSFVLGTICLVIAIFFLVKEKEDNITKLNNIGDIEIISFEDKINLNTKFTIAYTYLLCNHTVEKNVAINKENINCDVNDIIKKYNDFEVIEFNKNNVVLSKKINQYCPEHYLIKEENERINIYKLIDKENTIFYELVDIDTKTLRQNDRRMFMTTGVNVYGYENLRKIIEDFNS